MEDGGGRALAGRGDRGQAERRENSTPPVILDSEPRPRGTLGGMGRTGVPVWYVANTWDVRSCRESGLDVPIARPRHMRNPRGSKGTDAPSG